ncbi:MAG: phosphoribosylanthranilate isomerase [Chloroflexi bacterium]|nr:MAG: phosphoribosylanthranilate isomerase [Chloroflexota bacterium]
MKVKICGVTNLADAETAVSAGADYLGFIFYPKSKRAITQAEARAIVAQLRTRPDCPHLVGVFVNETAETIARILDECQLDLAQLSGEEVPWMVGDPRSPIYGRAYKALRPASLPEAEAEAEWYIPPQFTNQPPQRRPNHPALLIDTWHPVLRGGTGQTGNWEMSAHLAHTIPNLMLAGGLTPENVAEAVRQVRPFAVDVASGVEFSPGQKDPDKVRTFIHRAKNSLTENQP